MKRSVTPIALVLTTMLLAGCVTGSSAQKVRIDPSGDLLRKLVSEYSTSTYGPATKEVVKDWVSQNEITEE